MRELVLSADVVYDCIRSDADGCEVCESPYTFVDTPDGVAVGVSFACPGVRARRGPPLPAPPDAIRAARQASTRSQAVPAPVPLHGALDIDWAQYRSIEAGLLALVGDDRVALPTALLAGSMLVGLCVALTQAQARGRRQGCAPSDTLASGLSQLHAGGYQHLLGVAARARCPRRGALTPLAPLYTWLEISGRRPASVATALSLYRNLFRFRRGRGRVPDWITGGRPVDLAAIGAVTLEPWAPGVGDLLRRYVSHLIFRKTLTPMHGVFRGYQTMLAIYAFTRWTARLVALRAGRRTAGVEDVGAAIALVEQRVVLHPSFAGLFRVSPILTLLMDRLYRQPSFVRAAALDRDSA